MKMINLVKNNIVKNTFWLTLIRVYQMLVNLFTVAIVSRYLGPDGIGLLNYSIAIISFLIPLSTLGFNKVVIKEFVGNKYSLEELIGTSIIFTFCSGIFILIILFAYSFFIESSKIIGLLIMIQSVIYLLNSFKVFEYWLQSALKSKVYVIMHMITFTIMSAVKIYLVYINSDIYMFAFATLIDQFLLSLLLVLYYFKKNSNKNKFTYNKNTGLYLLSNSKYFIISGFLVILYTQIDKVMIMNLIGESAVGLYTAAITVSNLWVFIPIAIITSLQPILLKSANVNSQIFKINTRKMYSLIFYLGVVFSIFIFIMADLIIYLIYGHDFKQSASILKIAIWFTIFSTLGESRNIWLVAKNLQRFNIHFFSIGVIINVLLNFLLIPSMGIKGAAIATLVTQLATTLIAPMLFHKTREFTMDLLKSILLIR